VVFLSGAFTLLLTGLSCAGKSTLATVLSERLKNRDGRVQVLDGDIVRNEIGNLFGYSREERIKASTIVRFMAKTLNQNGIPVIIAAITPYQEMRDAYRRELKDDYVEVYVKCPLEVCIDRDVQGLYQRALRGDLKNFVGIDEAYEIPLIPDLTLETSTNSIETCVGQICEWFRDRRELKIF
jgi:adenylyl-sulfate kinase